MSEQPGNFVIRRHAPLRTRILRLAALVVGVFALYAFYELGRFRAGYDRLAVIAERTRYETRIAALQGENHDLRARVAAFETLRAGEAQERAAVAHEIADLLAEPLLLQNRQGGLGAHGDIDEGRFDQTAEIRAGGDQAAKGFHLRHDGVESAGLVGMRVERGGIAVNEAAAFRDRGSFRRHVRFHLSGHAPKLGPRGTSLGMRA